MSTLFTRSIICRLAITAALLLATTISLLACGTEPTVAPPSPTETSIPTQTPLPTYTPYPTTTPYPTATPYPTLEPLPTHTPYPTVTPYPTQTPYPTATPYPTLGPLPTHTPYPTAAPYPTPTPYPTPQTITRVQTVVEENNWKKVYSSDEKNIGSYITVSGEESNTVLILQIDCDTDDTYIWLSNPTGYIFSDAMSARYSEESLLVKIDGRGEEQTWHYFPADESSPDFFAAKWDHNLLTNILEAQKLVFTIPTAGSPYTASFDVDGLDRHIKKASDCGDGSEGGEQS